MLFLIASAAFPAASSVAPAHAGPVGCLAATIESLPSGAPGTQLYRIVFVNRCDAPRSFFWCAENPSLTLPPGLGCPRAVVSSSGVVAETRHAIRQRKEFQWHLPPGSRIRFHDCPVAEVPTTDFGCTAPTPPAPARR